MAAESRNRPDWCRAVARWLRKAAYRLDPVRHRDECGCARYDELIERMERLLAERRLYCDKSISIEMMAEELGTNRTYLSKALRSRNMTFSTCVNGYRIWCAASQLARCSMMDITEVAEVSGFTNVRSLRYFVKQRYGITLTDFRQRISQLLSELQAMQIQQPCRKDGLQCPRQL